MKNIKRVVSSIMAITVLAVCSVGISANASVNGNESVRSNSSSWYLQRVSGAPSSTDSFEYSGVVTGLRNGVDDGVTFKCTNFQNSGNPGLRAVGDIPSKFKRYTDIASLTYNGCVSTCIFKDDWYGESNGGRVSYTVTVENYASYAFRIDGTAY
ncbi:MAG: hypothetical protein IKI94_00475 [Ruminococcus sp.]|nr:hypothetical protein [Ruminococcus sp.]